ncbi:MAG TPA: glucose 1-dehydrogenase [Stellaceae bacterium]|nr:glucose 1-dehydrogenase [Stellaceae bacterium]
MTAGKLEGKVAIVTGAARGMGKAFAEALAGEGAKVVVSDLLEPEGRAVAARLGGNGLFIRHDVSKAADWHRAIDETESRFGPVSILVNNAGIAWFATLEDSAEADVRRMIEIDQLGVFLGMQSIVPSMRRAGGGSIINIASVASLKGTPSLLAYSACKWAVRGMTKCAALDLGGYGIRVNAVHPGMIDTIMSDPFDPPLGQPIPRKGSPQEVARTVLFLASDESSYTTGCDFVVDGGMTIAV